MSDENSDLDRYFRAAHAMQSGVAMEMNHAPESTQPKHLRVGINTSMSDHAALVTLLIDKGVFTQEEYAKALADAMESEKKSYEQRLSQHFGKPITLL
jgi:hypothetical protein